MYEIIIITPLKLQLYNQVLRIIQNVVKFHHERGVKYDENMMKV